MVADMDMAEEGTDGADLIRDGEAGMQPGREYPGTPQWAAAYGVVRLSRRELRLFQFEWPSTWPTPHDGAYAT